MYLIYKITNLINNKVYIGQSINPIEERWRRHCNDALNNVIDTHFARAIRKYGKDAFKVELLDDTAQSQTELTEQEHYYIDLFNSRINGYNETDAVNKCGGNTYLSKTPEEMNIIRTKLSESKLGGKNPQAKGIKCKNVKTNEELFFSSMAEGAKYFNMTSHQPISRRCRGEIISLYNSEWMFAYADSEYNNFTTIPNAKRTKQVEVTNIFTGEVKTYNNYHAAEKACGFGKDYLSKTFRKTGQNEITRDVYKIVKLN